MYTKKDFSIIIICLVIYITALFASNTIGSKLMPFVWGTSLSVAVFYFPFVFIMTDVIGEVYGKAMAKDFVLAGFLSIVAFLIFTFISSVMPWSDKSLWMHDGYNQIFGLSIRISIASLLAFVIAEYQDVIAFFFFKRKIGQKGFWLRSNLSNIWSQLLDTVIFMFVAFLGVYSIPTILSIIIPWWLYKVVMGFLYTPLSYGGIYIINKLRNYEYSSNQNTNI